MRAAPQLTVVYEAPGDDMRLALAWAARHLARHRDEEAQLYAVRPLAGYARCLAGFAHAGRLALARVPDAAALAALLAVPWPKYRRLCVFLDLHLLLAGLGPGQRVLAQQLLRGRCARLVVSVRLAAYARLRACLLGEAAFLRRGRAGVALRAREGAEHFVQALGGGFAELGPPPGCSWGAGARPRSGSPPAGS